VVKTGARSSAASATEKQTDGVRRSSTEVVIKPLTTARFEDLSSLFMQGGDPKWCWCMFFRAKSSWGTSTAKKNRESLRGLAARKLAPGLVAYQDGEAVGWVSLAPREEYDRLEASKVLARIDDKPVWSIVCFVVSRRRRGQGIAAALLAGAIEYARRHGASTLEAYPVADDRGRIPASAAFHGAQSMYARAGFTVAEVRQWNKATPRRPIMRLELT
jgi:GNAT superfamily N-acetyltransferase